MARKKDLQFCVVLSDGETWTTMDGCDLYLVDLSKVPNGAEATDDRFLDAAVASWNLWWLLRDKLLVLSEVHSCKGAEARKEIVESSWLPRWAAACSGSPHRGLLERVLAMSKRGDLQFAVVLGDRDATWSPLNGDCAVHLVDKNVARGVKGDDLRAVALGTWELESLLSDMLSQWRTRRSRERSTMTRSSPLCCPGGRLLVAAVPPGTFWKGFGHE